MLALLPWDVLLPFFGIAVALAFAPGPDNIFVLTQSALYGRRAGLCVTLGLCTGLIAHTTAVALGVAALFKTAPLAFSLLQIVGAAYLLYLAFGAWRAARVPVSSAHSAAAPPAARALYLRGIVMNVSNPKVAIFFLAFLPQFTLPAHGYLSVQIMLLGAVFMLATLLSFGAIALLAGHLGAWLQRQAQAQIWLNRIVACVFVALALRLLFSLPDIV